MPGTHEDADPVGIVPVNVETGVVHGLLARRHRVLREAVHAPHLARIHVLAGIEVLHFTRDLRGKAFSIKAADLRNPRRAGAHGTPRVYDGISHRGHRAHAGDDYT